MRTIYYTASSLDGFIATEDDSLQWLFALGNPTDSSYPEFISQIGALAMGASTYLWLVQNSEQVKTETGSAWPYTQPTWIFSSRDLPRIEDADLRFVRGDVIPVHHQMKRSAEGKNLWIVGGGDLVGQFYDSGLLDEVIIQIGSVTLGRGKPVLPRQILPPQLQLQSVHQRGSGFVELRYLVSKSATPKPSP
ncbi:dihydrofolate reductase family protein [Pirellulaceae bacterium SH467]